MNASNCPQPEFLQQFLLGQLPIAEIERCQFHLSVCDPCVETIEMLKGDDTFTGQVRAAFLEHSEPDDEKANGEYVDQLIEQAGRWSRTNTDGLEPATASQVSIDRAAEVFRLLAEPAGEGEVGRLAHYSIVKLIGSGSTGVVFLASDTRLDRRVVLKILRPSLGQPAQTRFIAEAKATAAIEHPNVVTIYEVGSDGPLSYIAMQWTPGETLDQRLQNDEPLPLAEVRRLVAEVARGLAAAHASGLIHRDIKPANVWITEKTGEAKILDFGLVRVTDEDPQLTCTGMIAGTPCFMSPEQSRGDALDHRSDLFSLGCLLYQALTGRLPFRSNNALATLRSIQQDQPLAPAVLDPSIPVDVSDLTMCLLEKSPARRPPDAQSVAEALLHDRDLWKFLIPETEPQSKSIRKRRSSFWKTVAALTAGALLGIGGFVYGQQIIRVVTNQGEIVIETDVDDVKIEVMENGEVVRIVDLATEQSFEIRAGRYEIRPAGNDDSITLDKNSLTLTRGGQVVVRVTNNTTQHSVARTGSNSQPNLVEPDQRVKTEGLKTELARREEMLSDAKVKFEKNEISKLELLQVEFDKLNYQLELVGGSSFGVELLKRTVTIKTEQFELLSERLTQLSGTATASALDTEPTAENAELVDIRAQRDAVRQELAIHRRQLSTAEEKHNLPPSQPIYDGQTYEELLGIVRTERNLEKLNPALKGLITLASEHEKPEMLEAVMPIARQVHFGLGNDQSMAFYHIMNTVFRTMDYQVFTRMFVNELKHGNDKSQQHFSRGLHLLPAMNDLASSSSNEHMHCVNTIVKALDEFTANGDRNKLGYAMSVISAFFPSHESVKFTEPKRTPLLVSVRPIVQRYIKYVLTDSDNPYLSFISSELFSFDIWIARYFPNIEGHQSSIEYRLNRLLEIPQLADDAALRELGRILQIVEQLPKSMRSKTQVANLANKLFAGYRLQGQSMPPSDVVQPILKLLDMDANLTDEIEFSIKKYLMKNRKNKTTVTWVDSSIEYFKLFDGEYVFRASGKDEPAAASDDVEKSEK